MSAYIQQQVYNPLLTWCPVLKYTFREGRLALAAMSVDEVVYLSKAAEAFPHLKSYLPVRNHFLWLCHAKQGKTLDRKLSVCPNCIQPWSHGMFTMCVQKDVSPGPRMLQILKKQNITPHSLNKVEKKLFLRYMKRKGNKIVLHCSLCLKDTMIKLNKPTLQEKQKAESLKSQDKQIHKKRKKKKDQYAGLNVSAVLSAVTSPLSKTKKGINNFQDNNLSKKGIDKIRTPHSTLQHSNEQDSSPKVREIKAAQVQDGQNFSVKSTYSVGNKMRLLREKQRKKEQDETEKLKSKIKRNGKLRNFLNQQDRKVDLEDRIQSLLEC